MTDTPTNYQNRESEHDHELILAEHRMINDRGGRTRRAIRATYVVEAESLASSVSGSQPESFDCSQADENSPTRELSQERGSMFSDTALEDIDHSVLLTSAGDDSTLTALSDEKSETLAANLHDFTTTNGALSLSDSTEALLNDDPGKHTPTYYPYRYYNATSQLTQVQLLYTMSHWQS